MVVHPMKLFFLCSEFSAGVICRLHSLVQHGGHFSFLDYYTFLFRVKLKWKSDGKLI